MRFRRHAIIIASLLLLFFFLAIHAEDPYKILGLKKGASQHDIKRAFRRLSLKYHPDKNPSKDSQAKYADISNAYDLLTDEEKRKKYYDMYGDVGDGFSSSSNEGKTSFFGGAWWFLGSIFGNLFSFNRNGRQASGSWMTGTSHLSSMDFGSKVLTQYYTWAILFYPTSSAEVEENISVLDQVATGLNGSIKVGSVDCGSQLSLCKEQNLWPLKKPKLYFYSLGSTGKIRALEYVRYWSSKDIKEYCIEVLPRFSTHLEENDLIEDQMFPQAVLITKEKDAPAIWRALSGLFYERVLCFNVQAHDMSSSIVKRFKINSLPAMVGVLPNGETYVISSGSSFDQASASVEGLQRLFEDLVKKSMEAGYRSKISKDKVPLLTKENVGWVCGSMSPLCVIAAFKSASTKLKVKQILDNISNKRLTRSDHVSYALLNANMQASFTKALGIETADIPEACFLIAYKPRKGKFAVYKDSSFNPKDAEDFVVGILGGDVQFKKIEKNPVLVD